RVPAAAPYRSGSRRAGFWGTVAAHRWSVLE
ncbi:hypothetical protein A2U01_0116155, partial [Trifolium medium]|nr:hypothetical protein [Trifolium medium]